MPEPTAHAGDTVTLDTSPSMAMTTLYGAAIGPIGSDYYLPIFERFEAVGQGTLSWNWSACLYNLNWMIFRGLWGVVLVAAGA
ncbi:MAG TPA: sporulation protein, partial [Rhodoferax sp.]